MVGDVMTKKRKIMSKKGTQSDIALSVHNCVPKTEFYWAMIDNAQEHLRINREVILRREALNASDISEALEILTGVPKEVAIIDIAKGQG
jgi:DNA gyrase/topoisomerase IV subunit A